MEVEVFIEMPTNRFQIFKTNNYTLPTPNNAINAGASFSDSAYLRKLRQELEKD